MKKRSAKAALELIEDGMIVGLGGGETIGYLVEYLSHSHKDVKVVTPSFATEQVCIQSGLELLPLWSVNHVDLSFDGCDEVDQDMNALKSGGAIQTREKLIASMSDRYILLIDESKYFVTLPFLHDITCEVLKEAYSYVSRKIKEMGGELILRPNKSKAGPVISDDGHFIVDVHFDTIESIKELNNKLNNIEGLIATSLFVGLVTDLIISNKEETYRIGGK